MDHYFDWACGFDLVDLYLAYFVVLKVTVIGQKSR